MKLGEILFIIFSPILFILGILLFIFGHYLIAIIFLIIAALTVLAQIFLLPYYLVKKPPKTEGKNYEKVKIKSY